MSLNYFFQLLYYSSSSAELIISSVIFSSCWYEVLIMLWTYTFQWQCSEMYVAFRSTWIIITNCVFFLWKECENLRNLQDHEFPFTFAISNHTMNFLAEESSTIWVTAGIFIYLLLLGDCSRNTLLWWVKIYF